MLDWLFGRKKKDNIKESYYGLPGTPYPGSLTPFFLRDFDRFGGMSGWFQNRNNRGGNPQAYLTENDLRFARERSRDLACSNEYARNALRVRQVYTIGTGLRVTVMPRAGVEEDQRAIELAQEVQSFLEVWAAHTKAVAKQKESVLRFDRDGEAFIRVYDEGDILNFAFLEPEHIGEWTSGDSFGIKTDPDNIGKVLGYWYKPMEQSEAEFIEAEKIVYCKANTDSGIKRGLPYLYPIFNVLEKIEGIDASMAATIKIQASIAMIRKHGYAKSDAIESALNSRKDFDITNHYNGSTTHAKHYQPGSILDTDGNTEYEFPSMSANMTHAVNVKSSLLRTAAAGVGMPEYMLTSDASNGNYASSQVAESPVIADFLACQHYWGDVYGQGVYIDGADNGLMWRAIKLAVDRGSLPDEALDMLTLKCEGPNIVVRDRNQETNRLKILVDGGIIKRDQWARMEGMEKAAMSDDEYQAKKDEQADKEMKRQMAAKPVGNQG